MKVLEITCKYCGHKWVEKPKVFFEDLGNKFQRAGQELARPLFPWTPIEKKDKKRCPKCGSEIFSSRLIELRD
jgi:DNA-directed RNA polymerase subunit RPC12/RpoP